MADQYVPITPGSGTKIDVSEIVVGANTVERQRVILGSNTTATDFASIFPAGFLRTSDEPRQVFYDPFDLPPDTTNVWSLTAGNNGIVPNVTTGMMFIGSGTSAAGWSSAATVPAFVPVVPAWLGGSFALRVESPVMTNATRFWGFGTVSGTPTPTQPLTNGIGFELDTNGKLFAVVYANSNRTVIADLSSATGNSTQPSDALNHRYIIYVRTDRSYWYIDNLTTPVAASSFQSPQVQTLPILMQSVNGSTPPSSSAGIACAGLAVWDTGKNATQISDGVYGWRKAQVGKSGGLSVKGTELTGTTGSIAVSGTGIIGPLDVSDAGNVTFVVKNAVAGNAFTGSPVLIFEQSDDNLSWCPLLVVRNDNMAAGSAFTLSANTANGSLMFDAPVESVTHVRCRVTVGPSSNAMTIAIRANGMPFTSLIALGGTLPSLSAGSNTIGTVMTSRPDTAISGTITTADSVVSAPAGDGTSRVGVSTGGSYVVIQTLGGESAWNVTILGMTTGTLYFEASTDSTNGINGNWYNIIGRQAGIINTVLSGNATSNGMYRGNTSAAAYFRVRAVGSLAGTPTVKIALTSGVGAIFLNASLPAGTNSIGTIQPPAITKGTQGSVGITTQDIKDAGRNLITLFMTVPIITTGTDTLMSLTGYKSGAAVTATTTPAVVTAGKTFRITNVTLTYVATNTNGLAKFTLRANSSGVVAISSPAVTSWSVGTIASTAGVTSSYTIPNPDGLEFAAGTGIGVSLVGLSQTMAASASGYAMITIQGFEY